MKHVRGKMNKAERMAIITKTLVENPSKVYTLQHFSDLFECAKSTLSEDMDVLNTVFEQSGCGAIQSISGASGGMMFVPVLDEMQALQVKEDLCTLLRDESRIITGGYLYTNDIFFDPNRLMPIARCIATRFMNDHFDYVVTIETKGIPLATILGQLLNKPVVVVRKSARLTEGATIQMNYVTGSSKTIKTMALPIKAIERGRRILFVDDFMKAGGTAKGVIDLMKAYDVEVAGVAVVMTTQLPERKLIDDYFALVELKDVDEDLRLVKIQPKE